jgi:hypothetical protein
MTEVKDVNWEEIDRRLNLEDSKSYGRVLLNPKPDCEICGGTGISKYTYDCGALNCTGHNNIICSCRELILECPYKNEHPNISGNWITIYKDGKFYVKCWNSDDHSHNPEAIIGEKSGNRVFNVLFLLHEKQPPYKKIRVKQGTGYIEGYEVVCPECGHTARILSTDTKHHCRNCSPKKVLIYSPEKQ